MSIRLLHLADVHLGAAFSTFGELAAERAAAHLDAFRRLPELAEADSVEAVLVAGDLFDGPSPPATVVAVAREAFRRLVEAGRPVFVVPGNHDAIALRPNPWDEGLGGAHVFREPTFGPPASVRLASGELHVYGLAFDPAREREPLGTFARADAEGVHVALLHGPVRDAPHWAASPNALRLDRDALAALPVDYLALGDYHRPRAPAEFGADGSVPACYPGSFAALDLTEAGPRGWVVVELEPGAAPRVTHRAGPLPEVQALGDVDVGTAGGDLEVAERVAALVEARRIPVARLVGAPEFPLDAERVRAELRERFGHAHVVDATRYFASARLDELAGQDTVTGHVVRLGRRRIEAAADEGAREVAEHALRLALLELGVR